MRRLTLFACLSLFLAPSLVSAQGSAGFDPVWAFRTRGVMTGISDSSEPAGYKVYSGISMEADVTRSLTRHLGLAWDFGTQSREVELSDASGKRNLGSIEVLPLCLMLQYRPVLDGRFHPYLGGGVQLNLFWEKSGTLDSMDLSPAVGPAIQAGFDYDISPRVVFNAEFRLSRGTTELASGGATVATIALHPSTLGAGIGFRF